MRVLVTGANGFVGYAATERLVSRGDSVVAFDSAIGPRLASLARTGLVHPVQGDITDMSNVAQAFKAYRPDVVLHFAAIVGVLPSIGSPSNVVRVNVQGSLNVFEAMRIFDVRRVLHLSSEEVYGDFRGAAAREDDAKLPLLPYGITKLAVEHLGRTYHDLHGLECINVRTSWVYGVGLDRPRPPMNYLNAALRGQAVTTEVGGDTVTDYTYIDDVIDGLILALDHPRHRYDAYNVASGEAVSEHQLAALIQELVPGATIALGPGRREFAPGIRIPLKGALDCSRARTEFGYEARFNARRGLAAYVAEWRRTQQVA